MLEASFIALTCGFNGTGISSMISIDKINENVNNSVVDTVNSDNTGTNVISSTVGRALINVGDSTQRFCLEKKIKLVSINLIIITSLAHHCISGLPGLLHALSSLVYNI
jgi:hypothetical protein